MPSEDDGAGRARLVVTPALANALGWGLRGQFGGELGATVPGALTGLALASASGDPAVAARAGRLGALGAFGFSFGGTETYGQTLALSHDSRLRERWYWWGLLGCAIKGGVWLGLGGGFLGIALGNRRHTPLHMLALGAVLSPLFELGVQLCNRPMEPPHRLPAIYFSNFHHPQDPQDPPRSEAWGGLGLGLLGVMGYLALRRDWPALRLAAGGMLGGACGFAGGQAVQAAGNQPGRFPERVNRVADWWKAMEMTFGLVGGAGLGASCPDQAGEGDPPLGAANRAAARLSGLAAALILAGALRERKWAWSLIEHPFSWGCLGMAAALGDDELAWQWVLSGVLLTTTANVSRHWAQSGMEQYLRPLWAAALALAGLGAWWAHLLADRDRARRQAATALGAVAWSQIALSQAKSLLNRDSLALDRPEQAQLPLARRVWQRHPGAVVTEGIFTVLGFALGALTAGRADQ